VDAVNKTVVTIKTEEIKTAAQAKRKLQIIQILQEFQLLEVTGKNEYGFSH
jgi:hypothetical protein